MAHMVADSELELHAMADRRGLRRERYQGLARHRIMTSAK